VRQGLTRWQWKLAEALPAGFEIRIPPGPLPMGFQQWEPRARLWLSKTKLPKSTRQLIADVRRARVLALAEALEEARRPYFG
jgi:hypothetical protein